jgi:N-acetylglucosamine malate deacetylase 1
MSTRNTSWSANSRGSSGNTARTPCLFRIRYNQDHRAVHSAALIALRPHDTNFAVSNVLLYEQVHVTLWPYSEDNLRSVSFNPAYHVPIDIERKIAAYQLHASQVRAMRSPDMLRTLARWRGHQSGCEFAEGFQVLRLRSPTVLTLGLSTR